MRGAGMKTHLRQQGTADEPEGPQRGNLQEGSQAGQMSEISSPQVSRPRRLCSPDMSPAYQGPPTSYATVPQPGRHPRETTNAPFGFDPELTSEQVQSPTEQTLTSYYQPSPSAPSWVAPVDRYGYPPQQTSAVPPAMEDYRSDYGLTAAECGVIASLPWQQRSNLADLLKNYERVSSYCGPHTPGGEEAARVIAKMLNSEASHTLSKTIQKFQADLDVALTFAEMFPAGQPHTPYCLDRKPIIS